jgi:hypothetical protein
MLMHKGGILAANHFVTGKYFLCTHCFLRKIFYARIGLNALKTMKGVGRRSDSPMFYSFDKSDFLTE